MSNGSDYWLPMRFEPAVERAYAVQLSRRAIPLLRAGLLIGAMAFAGYMAWDLLLRPDAMTVTGPLRLAIVVWMTAMAGVTLAPAVRDNPRALFWFSVGTYCAVAAIFALILGRLPGGYVAGVSGFILGMIFVPVIVNGALQATAVLAPLLLIPLAVMAAYGATSFKIVNTLAWTGGAAGFAVGFAHLLDITNRRAFDLERRLEAETARSEALLLNILPAEIAARLKAEEQPIADFRGSATVLFADLVGFTELSRQMSAAELVELLDDLFSRFDAEVERHGAEKIKTIGDAYMAAAGLTGGASGHVEAVANLALGMRAAFIAFREARGLDLQLRIGVHTGAVVAGVIGRHKFAYDLWGDTVNLASRMESEGLPDQIQISAEVRRGLPARYLSTARGAIAIKGHLPAETFLLRDAGAA